MHSLVRLQDIKVLFKEAGNFDCPAGGDDQATAYRRNQLEDLLVIQGVVQQDQCPLAIQDSAVHLLDLRLAVRQLLLRLIGVDDIAHCFHRRFGIGGTLHVHHDLAIRIAVF